MEVTISHDITTNLELASRKLGLDKVEIVNRAIKFYLHSMVEETLLKEDLMAWEKASSIDIENFERQL